MTAPLSHLRTRRRRLTLLLLPALLLRVVIPAGFMPFAGAGGAYLGFCPGAGPVPAPTELAAPAPHSGHTHHPGGAPDAPTHHHPACVFSAGATTEFAAILSTWLPSPRLQQAAVRVTSLVFLPAVLRAQSSRGPPVPA